MPTANESKPRKSSEEDESGKEIILRLSKSEAEEVLKLIKEIRKRNE